MPLSVDISGAHPATELCLEALQWLHDGYDFTNILDMGCGNGILGSVAASVWRAAVLAVDISPKAIEDTRRHIAASNLEALVTPLRADGFSDPKIRARGPYDLIIFNLLAQSLVRMARDVTSHLSPSGIALLSGIRSWEVAGTQEAYAGLDFEIIKEMHNSPWHLLIARHKAVTANFSM